MTRIRRYDALAGLLAAAVALGAVELMAGITNASLIVEVGRAIVDYTPGPVVKRAIEALGTHDKPTVLWSVVAVSLALGAALGPAAGRRRWVGVAAFAGFGLAGALAGARDPLTATVIAFLDAGVGALAGWVALRVLLDVAPTAPASEPTPPAGSGDAAEARAVMPRTGAGDRRRFFALAAGAGGAAALAGVVGRNAFGPAVDVEAQRRTIVLPTVRNTPTPLATAQPASSAGAVATSTPVATTAPAASATSAATPPGPVPSNPAQVDGISALVTPNASFYRIDTALVIPQIDASTWTLSIKGMVDHPYTLTFDDLLHMTSIEQSATLVCVSNEVGGNLAGNAVWLGVSLAEILKKAGVQAGASQVVGRSVDGFTVGFPTAVALDGRPSMVAVGMNGEPLPAKHGFPARLIVPGLYGYVSATKWLKEIELTTLEAFDAYWIPRGWSKQGPIKTQSRIDVPQNGRGVRAGPVPVAGVAWGGIRSISKVEVRITHPGAPADSGEWREARLGEALTQSSWRQWVYAWDATPGDYLIAVRATDGDGNLQVAEPHAPAPNGATGYHSVLVSVA